MKRMWVAMASAIVAACGTEPAPGPATGVAADLYGPGWTGATRPEEVIVARQELMEHIEELMRPIDALQVEEYAPDEVLREHADVIGAMLKAVPHLFPPTTNRFDPKATEPVTLALPPIWENFDGFYALADSAVAAAAAMSSAEGKAAQRIASTNLRAACDACHVTYLRPYPGPKVLPSDYEFDFDSVLPDP